MLRALSAFLCGILALVLFMWTPMTGRAILVYAALLAVVIVLAITLFAKKRARYWPNKPGDP